MRRTLALILCCCIPVAAQADRPGPVYLRLMGGGTTQSMHDWNARGQALKKVLVSGGDPVKWNEFGITVIPVGEIGVHVTDWLGVGVQGSMQTSTVDNAYTSVHGDYFQEKLEAKEREFLASVTIHPSNARLFWQVQGGIGWGTVGQTTKSYPGNDYDISGDWKGSAFVGGVAVGVQARNPNAVSLAVKLGYRLANLGKLDGSYRVSQTTQVGPPRDGQGSPMDTDFSGLYLIVGLLAQGRR